MFLRVLKLLILPLIVTSLVSALCQTDARDAKRMGSLTLGYYALTATIAAITGVVLVMTIHPGDPMVKGVVIGVRSTQQRSHATTLDTILDVIRNMMPENILQMTFQRVQTVVVADDLGGGSSPTLKKRLRKAEGINVLGVMVCSIAFGIALSRLGSRAKPAVDVVVVIEAVVMQLMDLVMWFAPFGILSLVTGALLDAEDLNGSLGVLSLYLLTVLAGLAIHTFVTMPGLYFLFTRRNPLRVVRGMAPALAATFGTASSGAALPVSIKCAEENLHIDRRVARFVLPLGGTANLDGNALYEAVAVVFIAQLNGVELSLPQVITVSFIAIVASLGLNAVPAGLVSILVILNTVDLPTDDVPLIFTIDWLM